MTDWDRFMAKVEQPPSGKVCWTWTAARNVKGYGRFRVGGKNRFAHRVIWAWLHGEPPAGMMVMHICDNPPCVNPTHLRLGTAAENTADSIAKGQYNTERRLTAIGRGDTSHHRRLTSDQVRAIRQAVQAGESERALATRYGVHRATIGYAVRGQSWASVED